MAQSRSLTAFNSFPNSRLGTRSAKLFFVAPHSKRSFQARVPKRSLGTRGKSCNLFFWANLHFFHYWLCNPATHYANMQKVRYTTIPSVFLNCLVPSLGRRFFRSVCFQPGFSHAVSASQRNDCVGGVVAGAVLVAAGEDGDLGRQSGQGEVDDRAGFVCSRPQTGVWEFGNEVPQFLVEQDCLASSWVRLTHFFSANAYRCPSVRMYKVLSAIAGVAPTRSPTPGFCATTSAFADPAFRTVTTPSREVK